MCISSWLRAAGRSYQAGRAAAAAGSVLSLALPVLRPLSDVNDSNIYPCTKPQDEISSLKWKTNLVVRSLYLPQSPSESLGELLGCSVKRG